MKRKHHCLALWTAAWVSASLASCIAWAEPGPPTDSAGLHLPGPCTIKDSGPGYDLKLSEEQRRRIAKIQDDVGHKHWELMGKIRDEQSRMMALYKAQKRTDSALKAINPKIAELQQQIFEHALDAQNQMDSVLSREQRHQLRQGGSAPPR